MNEVRKVEESKAKEIRIKEMVSDIYAKYMKGLSVSHPGKVDSVSLTKENSFPL